MAVEGDVHGEADRGGGGKVFLFLSASSLSHCQPVVSPEFPPKQREE